MVDPKALDFQSVEALQKFREKYEADFETGQLYRIKSRGGRSIRKVIKASNGQGYIFLKAFGRVIQAHRVIWFLAFGYWPNEIDHIDGIRSNNKLNNLRDVTHRENTRNSPAARRKLRIAARQANG